jgi:hypothetical protein
MISTYLDPFFHLGLRILRNIYLEMELAIPITKFNPENIIWGSPRDGPFRRTIPFGYKEDKIKLNNLILSLNPLKVIDIDQVKNQLILEEIIPSSIPKIEQLQINIIHELEQNTSNWIEKSKIPLNIRSPLQLWVKSKRLTLYLSPEPSSLNFYTDAGQIQFTEDLIKPGDIIRAIIKIQGLSLQVSDNGIWTGKSRIQHQILQIFKISTAVD